MRQPSLHSTLGPPASQQVATYPPHSLSDVQGVVDVWCDAPIEASLDEVLAIPEAEWPFPYRFIVGMCVFAGSLHTLEHD